MNYLAHIFLSGTDAQLQVGNFIGDFVKGSQHANFPEKIQQGILLHREIDAFTDTHPVVREIVAGLRPSLGRYSGIIADMYFDYMLASDFDRFSPQISLNSFARRFYASTLWNYRWLPERVQGFLFHFISTNRLKQYASLQGLHTSLEIMANYKIKSLQPQQTILYLVENEKSLREGFHEFMPDVIQMVSVIRG